MGDARFDDALPDQAEGGRAERHRVHAGLLAAAGGIDAARLVPEERRALALATALARRELGCLEHGMDRLWAVGHMPIGFRFGRGLLLGVVAFQQPGGTAPQRAAYLRRLAAFPPPTCGPGPESARGERTLGAGAGPRWDREQAVPGASLERPCTPIERPIGNSRSHRSQGHEQEDP